MVELVQHYIDLADGDRAQAAVAFALGLMADDPAVHQRGYSRENAVLATVEAFGLDEHETDDLVDTLAS